MHPRAFALAGFVVFAAAGALAAPGSQWTPPTPTNLQVLDKKMVNRDLFEIMKGFTQSLGVRCQHCHVYTGDNPNNLAAFDFASDDKPTKRTARTMMRMTASINTEHLKGIGETPPAGEARVTCYTCHRGETKPQTRKPQA